MAYERKIPVDLDCGVTIYQIMVGGKWKLYLINSMNRGLCRPDRVSENNPRSIKKSFGATVHGNGKHGACIKNYLC